MFVLIAVFAFVAILVVPRVYAATAVELDDIIVLVS